MPARGEDHHMRKAAKARRDAICALLPATIPEIREQLNIPVAAAYRNINFLLRQGVLKEVGLSYPSETSGGTPARIYDLQSVAKTTKE